MGAQSWRFFRSVGGSIGSITCLTREGWVRRGERTKAVFGHTEGVCKQQALLWLSLAIILPLDPPTPKWLVPGEVVDSQSQIFCTVLIKVAATDLSFSAPGLQLCVVELSVRASSSAMPKQTNEQRVHQQVSVNSRREKTCLPSKEFPRIDFPEWVCFGGSCGVICGLKINPFDWPKIIDRLYYILCTYIYIYIYISHLYI